jgi:hypothetical protein
MVDAGEIPIDVRERDRFGVPFPPQNGPAGDALLTQFDAFGKPLPRDDGPATQALLSLMAKRGTQKQDPATLQRLAAMYKAGK